jgi:hypothetical protein
MSAPPSPRWCRVLLRVLLPRADREALLGDLEEELLTAVLPRLGLRRARRWYSGEIARSLPALLGLRLRRSFAHAPAAAAAGLLAFAAGAALAQALRGYVLSQVPMRDGGPPSLAFVVGQVAGGLVLGLVAALAAGRARRRPGPPAGGGFS